MHKNSWKLIQMMDGLYKNQIKRLIKKIQKKQENNFKIQMFRATIFLKKMMKKKKKKKRKKMKKKYLPYNNMIPKKMKIQKTQKSEFILYIFVMMVITTVPDYF